MKTNQMKMILRVLVLVCLAVTFVVTTAGAKRVLTVFHYPRDFEMARVAEINEVFTAKFPDVTVETVAGWADFWDTRILGGITPDVIFTDPSMIPSMVMKDYLMPLEPFLARDKRINLDTYIPAAVELTKWMGRQIGIPYDINPNGLVYNMDLFDEAGVPYPNENWTWEDLITTGKKLSMDRDGNGVNDRWGLYGLWSSLHIWIYQGGGQIWSNDWKECLMASPENVYTMEFLYKLAHEHKVAPPAPNTNMFINGEVAMTWGAVDFTDKPFFQTGRIGLTRHAIGPAGRHVGTNNGDFIALYRHTKQADLAWEYLVTAVEIIRRNHEAGRETNIPAEMRVVQKKFSTETFKNIQPQIAMLGKLFMDGVPNLSNHPVTNNFATWRNSVFATRYIRNNEGLNIRSELEEMQRTSNLAIQEAIKNGRKWWW